MSAAAPSGIAGIDTAAAAAAIESAGGLGAVMQEETAQALGTAEHSQGQQGATETGLPGQLRDPVTGRWVSPGQEVSAQQPGQAVPPVQEGADAFTATDPNSLAPELQPIYKSLQADYTRKTQEIAAQRKLIEELGGSEQITEAARLYQSLQNPASWPQLYDELRTGMEQLGLSPQEAHVVANQEVARQQEQAGVQAPPSSEQIDWSDPELEPLKVMFDTLDKKISGIQDTFKQREETEKQERLQMAVAGEMQRQENAIRQMHPNYTDDDLDAIYELSSFHGGNLLNAQKRYEEIAQSRLSRFLAQKESAVGNSGVGPIPGGGTVSGQPLKFGSLDEAHKAAMESLRQMEAMEQ